MIDVFKISAQGNGTRYLRTLFKECERSYVYKTKKKHLVTGLTEI